MVDAGLIVGVDSSALLIAVVVGEDTVTNENLLSLDADGRSFLTSFVAII